MTLLCGQLSAQGISGYYQQQRFGQTASTVFQNGLLGFSNPANLQFVKNGDLRFVWQTDGDDAASLADWGILAATKGLGFGMLRDEFGPFHRLQYRIGTGFGDEQFALGLAYGWSRGDFAFEKSLTTGFIFRPLPYLSVGASGQFSTESEAKEGVFELGIRPLGNRRLTLFADAAIQNGMELKDAPWSVGAVVEAVPGLNISGRYFESEAFTIGLTFDLGQLGFGGQSIYDSDGNVAGYTYQARLGDLYPGLLTGKINKGKGNLPFNLKGKVDYLNYKLWDDETHKFSSLLAAIKNASGDPQVGVISVNLSSAQMRPENAWEIREALNNARQAGKKVIVFIDNAGMTTYHLASVADYVVLDPQGMIELPGFILGRTYVKGTLEKLGLAFDEWRFFKYKSAAEALSRESMSEADREQRQAFVDDWYELVRADIAAGRNLSPQKFDEMVDEQVIFLPDKALEVGLADTLARWSAMDEVVTKLTGIKARKISTRDLLAYKTNDLTWGEKPKVAVVYGLGECAMDTGIRARWLEKVFLKLAKDKSVKAVVFRVDSPGGDGMASDLVAEAIKKCKEEKPVIISQGQVAGSGGYWISMYGDEILAGPNTITGSIGVIGGWLYDNGFTDKLGLSADMVKRGKHADLGFGPTMPVLGAKIPARNLTADERAKMEKFIKQFYEEFVAKVAAGRNLPVEEVKKIAEGRIYSGIDGKEVKLVDKIGGLLDAIAIAKMKSGLAPEQTVKLVEYPQNKGLFPIPSLGLSLKTQVVDPSVEAFIRIMSDKNGQPLPMLTPGNYPEFEK
ncbi:MAG: hypothetical protein Kow0037_30540 [Calditrichia bacterium]